MFSALAEEHIKKYLYLYAFLFSIISSLILINSRVIINADGVVYLAASQALIDDGILAARAIESNSFLPILIVTLSKISNLSLIAASDVVNSILMALLVVTYIYFIKQLGGNKTVQLIAAILILLNPSLNGYRESILRDPGYWAFLILSLALLLQYAKNNNYLSILLWIISLLLASLFRPEAALFSLAPVGLLFLNAPLKLKFINLAKVYLCLLSAVLLILLILNFLDLESLYQGAIDHLNRYRDPGLVQAFSFKDMSDNFAALFTYPYPSEYVWLGYGLSLIPVFVASLSGALSWPMLVAFTYCYYRKVLSFPASAVYRMTMILAILMLLVFLFRMSFLTPRYSTFLGLLLISALPFSLYKLYAGQWQATKVKIMTALFLIILMIDSFISFGYSQKYLTEGIDWVNQNTPTNSRVISNEREISYSIDREKKFIDSQTIFNGWPETDISNLLENYDYFVEDAEWDDREVIQTLYPEAEELIRFTSERGNRFIVYKLQ